jgi:hypothetical protein
VVGLALLTIVGGVKAFNSPGGFLNGMPFVTRFFLATVMLLAAGVGPAPPQNVNWLMAREIRCLRVSSLSSGVRLESSGIVPSFETCWRRSCPPCKPEKSFWRQQPGTPAYCRDLEAAALRRALAEPLDKKTVVVS